jgi:alkanesulfonate monooxygenase SsuD/methylene tetrahydromethanopterin reductase-like flavin-dependent oxidoreductase (luciferase family)
LRVGIQLPEVERLVGWPEYAAMARAAEAGGFDSIWVGDHALYRDTRGERGPWDCWTLLAALAAVTERVDLGPLVAATAFRPPALLARAAAATQEVSGGRLVLGLGAGWNAVEFEALGLPFDRPVARFAEAFEIVCRLLAGERVTYAGRFYSVDDAVVLPRPERPPKLMVGANGPRILGIALPHVDTWNTWHTRYGNAVEGFAEHNSWVSEQAERAGRDPAEVERSACVLVQLEGGVDERPETAEPVSKGRLRDHLEALAEAGADEAILVASPITEASVRELATLLPRRQTPLP